MSKPSTIVNGVLLARPIEGEAKGGRRFVSARLREDSKLRREWLLFAWSDHVRAELRELRRGEDIAAIGTFDARITDEGQTPRIAWRLAVTHIFTFGVGDEEPA